MIGSIIVALDRRLQGLEAFFFVTLSAFKNLSALK